MVHQGTNFSLCFADDIDMIESTLEQLQADINRLLTDGEQEAQLMLTTGSTRLAVSRGQQTWYHSTCYI